MEGAEAEWSSTKSLLLFPPSKLVLENRIYGEREAVCEMRRRACSDLVLCTQIITVALMPI